MHYIYYSKFLKFLVYGEGDEGDDRYRISMPSRGRLIFWGNGGIQMGEIQSIGGSRSSIPYLPVLHSIQSSPSPSPLLTSHTSPLFLSHLPPPFLLSAHHTSLSLSHICLLSPLSLTTPPSSHTCLTPCPSSSPLPLLTPGWEDEWSGRSDSAILWREHLARLPKHAAWP